MKNPWQVRAFSKTLTLARSRSSHRRFSSESSTFALKTVTRSNFDSSLDDLRRHVRAADFVSVDIEMTGITSAPWRESLEFDRSDVRYLKVKDSAEKFAAVQFGVCPFRWDGLKESFIAHPHNFYIFPRKELTVDGPSYEFLCQTTSVDFLAKYQFDFNACIHEGISYLSREQEAEALRILGLAYDDKLANSQGHLKDAREIPLESTFDVLFTERMKNRFRKWRDWLLRTTTEESQFEANSNGSIPHFRTVFFKMCPALMLNGFTSHQLRLIQLKEVNEDLRKEVERKVTAAVGFRHVIDLLASEQKLVVGHNCFLDLAHIYSKFFGPLPSTVEEFASSIHKSFPYVIDTKRLLKGSSIIQHLMKKNRTSLSSAFAVLCPQIANTSNTSGLASRPCVKVEVQVDDLRSSSWNSGAKHEAGYDAFMTGCIFAQACNHIGIDFKLHSPSTELAKSEKLQMHINLLYLSWNSGTLINLKTGTEIPESGSQNYKRRYPKIVFDNTVLIWGFPSKFKPRELRECICEVFGPDSVTSIYYLDETAAFIQFSKEEFASDFLVLKDTLEMRNDPISVLHPLAKLLEGGSTHVGNYDIYKQICSSPIARVLFADQAEAVGIRWKTEVEGETEKPEMACLSERVSGNPNSNFSSKSVTGKKGEVVKDLDCKFSCEHVLDSLYVIQSPHGKQTRTV
ncbi:poly(A)-specific ribonuclease PARN isoform X2 [Magnolia sinica]|uniref:poly(A)-specific ribonuclease PARN isoform X2 n=1 Tax=Magnolia sinica TaxID=86752 RepID=UPI0026597C42|nr:poly(A)-specific ribonuclease PARN isoform X2 [Magnolia sinica]